MPRPVTDIPNLGPASAEAFARAGITTAEEIIELGPDEAYLRLLRSGSPPHFIGYYVLVMGLQGRPWNDCKGKEKDDLRKRFDALKAQVKSAPGDVLGRARLEAALNEIGLVARRA
jgi:hypothetical protein